MNSKIIRYFISNCFAKNHHLSLSQQDPEIYHLIQEASKHQCIDFTESPTSLAVQQSLGSMMSTKYASGYPGKKNKPGTEIYDKIEQTCWERAQKAFNLNNFNVNVQLQSVPTAKFIVSKALVKPGGTILNRGNTDTIALEKYYNVIKNENYDGQIDLIIDSKLDKLDTLWQEYKNIPILLDITDKAPYYVTNILEDESKLLQKYQFVIVNTQSLLGPKGCILFSDKVYSEEVDEACYPGYQSGPHFHTITGITVSLGEIQNIEYQQFFKQVKGNCAALKRQLKLKEFPLIETQGTCISIEGKQEDSKKLEISNIYAHFRESRLDFNLIPLTYKGVKQDAIPKLAECLGLALYHSRHGRYLQDENNSLWKRELEGSMNEFYSMI
ncbi:unnamed protein product [Paramecium pentaurelia]|uniref:Serine hydroxymethyltransferase-like domain-containing protein n=1 Tax=Paramecium pentaurelia TaxID=43138 RepID=A0A8S1YF53_9CILI|nr:unnamed protein product [Paramecium pentaurelia]